MSDTPTPRTDAAIVEKILCTEGGDNECTVYPVVEHVEADVARELERELAEAKALVSERESRLANIKFLLEPIYGSTNYAPIGGTLDRVLNICDRD